MSVPTAVQVRAADGADGPAVAAAARRAFAPFFWPFLLPTLRGNVLIATTARGQVLGGTVLRVFRAGGRRFGLVLWIFADPSAQGAGVGKALVDAATRWFREHGCEQAVASVDGYNSRSWNLFTGRGFRYWPVTRQLEELGLHWPALAWGAFHFLDVGNFLLVRDLVPTGSNPVPPAGRAGGPEEDTGPRKVTVPTKEALYALAGTAAALLVVMVWRSNLGPALPAAGRTLLGLSGAAATWSPYLADLAGLAAGLVVTLAVVAAFAVATLGAQAAVAYRAGVPVAFRAWDSGPALGLVVALLFGFMAAPGGWYVQHAGYRYGTPPSRALLGRMAAAGAVVIVALLGLAAWGQTVTPALATITAGGAAGVSPVWALLGLLTRVSWMAGAGFTLYGVVLCFPPFQALPAAHLFRWSPLAWAAATAASLFLVFR